MLWLLTVDLVARFVMGKRIVAPNRRNADWRSELTNEPSFTFSNISVTNAVERKYRTKIIHKTEGDDASPLSMLDKILLPCKIVSISSFNTYEMNVTRKYSATSPQKQSPNCNPNPKLSTSALFECLDWCAPWNRSINCRTVSTTGTLSVKPTAFGCTTSMKLQRLPREPPSYYVTAFRIFGSVGGTRSLFSSTPASESLCQTFEDIRWRRKPKVRVQ